MPTLTATVSATAHTLAAATGTSVDLLVRGALVGRYVILDCVGAGGMGRVYSAFDPELGRKVALKLLHDETPDEPRQARLRREAQVMARLSHPNICPVYDVGTFRGRGFFAMEFVDGVTLRTWLSDSPRPWQVVVELFMAIGRGITAAHAEGLVHSDLKPENIMIGADERPRVMDFGITRADGAAEASSAWPTIDAEQSGGMQTIRGTPQYMAPEQWGGPTIDARADQFAFCVMFWEALFGARPFRDGHVAAQVLARRPLQAPAPVQQSSAPAWLRAVLLRGLATEPDQRFATMDALLAAVSSARIRRRRSLAVAGLAALALVLGAGFGLRLWQRQRQVAACDAAGASVLVDAWNDAARARVASAFAGSELPDADKLSARIGGLHDVFAERWRQTRSEACLVDDARALECLSDQRQTFAALLAAFTASDAHTLAGAIRVAGELPDPRSCEDPARVSMAAPEDGLATRSLTTALRQELRRVGVLGATGRTAEARARARVVRELAARAGLHACVADALHVAGTLAERDAEHAEAALLLRRALVEAGASRRDDIAADAAIKLVELVGSRLARPEEALLIGRFAEMLVRRLGQIDRHRGARLLGSRAVVLAGSGALSEARAASERALELLRAELGQPHPEVSLAIRHLAKIVALQGEHREALALFAEALASAEELHGVNSREAADCRSDMALSSAQLGARMPDEPEGLAAR